MAKEPQKKLKAAPVRKRTSQGLYGKQINKSKRLAAGKKRYRGQGRP